MLTIGKQGSTLLDQERAALERIKLKREKEV